MKRLIVLLLTMQVIISAQTDSLKIYVFKPITISVSKFEESLRTLSLSNTTVRQDELIQGEKSSMLGSINGKVAGLFISEKDFTGFGISNPAGRISIRGISGTQEVLVVVDGRPEFAGIFGHPVADNYYSSQIEAVDVIKGPASVIYGTNAMGGVISITTKKNYTKGVTYSGELNYGTYNSRNVNGTVGIKTEKFDADVSFSNDYSDNSRPSSSFNSSTGMINSSYSFSSVWSAGINAYINTTKSYDPGKITNPNLNNTAWTDITRANASLTIRNKYEQTEGAAVLFFNNGVHDVYDGFHSNDKMLGANVYQGFSLFKDNITTAGAEIKNYGGTARNKFPMIDTTVTESAAYVTMSQKLSNEFSLNGGLRVTNHSVYGTELIPQVNAEIKLQASTKVNISASKGFRSPTLGELFLFGANANLKPERLWNYEVAVKQKLFAGKMEVGLNGFLIEGRDLIVMTGTYPNLKNQNINSVENRGFEAQAEYSLSKNFSVNANYSYTSMGTQIIGTPESQAYVEANYNISDLFFNLNMKSITSLLTAVSTPQSAAKKQSFILLNAAVWYKLIPQVTLYVKSENLTGSEYQIIDGYPMPGTTVRFGFSFNGTM